MSKKDLIVILGPTATGKTNLAAQLAHQIDGEIISADSRQVYKGMDVGTGKDLGDFKVDGVEIPFHLIDIVEAGTEYNLFKYQTDFLNAFKDINSRGKRAILCGGTGMYIEAAIKGYRLIETPKNKILREELSLKTIEELGAILKEYKKVHNTTDTVERERIIRAIEIAKYESENKELTKDFPLINYQLFGIDYERTIIRERITKRLKQRFKNEGMIEEVEQLIANGVSPEKLMFYGLEYKFITQFLLNEITRKEMFNKLEIAIHQFAKRQSTWFRKMERNGFNINWIDGNLPLQEKVQYILSNS